MILPINQKNKRTYTRKINSKLGVLGFMGFLGFGGFFPILLDVTTLFPIPGFFFFFAFFGFFGFYYQGKMSDTFIDERYEANAYHASALANKAALLLIFTVTVLTMSVFRIEDTYHMLSVLIAVIGLAVGISVFLEQYLLYRFENEE